MDRVEKDLLRKYFRGEVTDTERERVIEYFVEKKYYSSLKKEWSQHFNEVMDNETKESSEDIRPVLDRIHHRMNIISYKRSRRRSWRKFVATIGKAAAFLFIPLLLFAGWYIAKNPFKDQILSNAELVAPRGARIHFVLPDGTKGWLNSESSLSYPILFRGKERRVILKGEGYFEVTKDEHKPFVVKAGRIEVVALGTKFDVNAYPDDNMTEVTLISGKVQVMAESKGNKILPLTVLDPGQQIEIRKVDLCFKTEKVEDPKYYAAWKDGKLIFRNDPMTEVAKKLGRWYNVEILLQEKNLEDYRYHATFRYESLDEVLKLIKLTSPVDYKIIKRKKLPDGTFTKKRIILFAKKNIHIS